MELIVLERITTDLSRNERGLALPMALGFVMVLSIALVSVLTFTRASQQSSKYSDTEEKAFALAEAGLERASSVLASSPDAANPAALGSGSEWIEGGMASYSGTLSGSTWTLTGTGTVRNPAAGGADVTRTVTGQFTVVPTAPIWIYNVSDSPTGCMTVPSSATVSAPLFIRASLCLSNAAQVTGSPLHVGGTVTLNGSSSVGTSVLPIASANLVGGCTGGVPNPHPCTSSDRVYASSITQNPSSLTKPPINLAYWYQNARPGPVNGCTSGSVPGGFDNDGTMNGLRPVFNLTPAAAYSCTVTDGSGNTIGQLAWSPVTRVLNVRGTIFFDGDIEFTNSAATYQGRATLYSSGRFSTSSSARLCGVAGCTSLWNPSANLLVLVAGSSTATYGIELVSNVIFQGAGYAVMSFRSASGAQFWGPVMANQLVLSHQSLQAMAVGDLPLGAPGTAVVEPVAGSWRG